ncbi:MAG: CvpA family protein [Acutalibacteraceae bacterium]
MSAIVDIILLIVLFVMILAGIKNGFVRCVLSIVAFTLAFAAAVFLSEPAAQTVYDNFAKEPIESAIAESITDTGTAQTAADSTQAVIDSLPEAVVSAASSLGIDVSQLAEQAGSINLNTSDMAAELTDKVAQPIALAVLKVLAFAVIFLILNLVLQIAVSVISRLFKLPVLKTFNHALGGALGAVKGLMLVVVLAVLLDASTAFVTNADFVTAVGNSKIVDIIVSTGVFSRLASA